MGNVEKADSHLKKYSQHRDFISNGITDKIKYSGWYVTAMYYAICHLTCFYCVKHNIRELTVKEASKAYDREWPLELHQSKFNFFEASRNIALYRCLCVTPNRC